MEILTKTKIKQNRKKYAWIISLFLVGIMLVQGLGANRISDLNTKNLSLKVVDEDTQPVPLPSIAPVFTHSLSVDHTEISPANQDGIKDNCSFSFETDLASTYNFTIEEDAKIMHYDGSVSRIAGNSSGIFLITSSRISNVDDDIYVYYHIPLCLYRHACYILFYVSVINLIVCRTYVSCCSICKNISNFNFRTYFRNISKTTISKENI